MATPSDSTGAQASRNPPTVEGWAPAVAVVPAAGTVHVASSKPT